MQNPRNMIGPELRRVRNARGLSQPKFAEVLQRKGWDISRDTLAKIESQTRWVSDFEVAFLAEVLKVPLAQLLGRHGRRGGAADYVARLERRL